MITPRILLVEDEPISSAITLRVLGNLGYNDVIPVTDGQAAIEQAIKYRPELVLMDIFLEGEMDGLEAARRINKVHSAPIVFLTGHDDIELIDRAIGTYSYGYLIKPINRASLHATIRMAIHKHRLELKLKTNEAELARHRDDLEALVAERTHELHRSEEKFRLFADYTYDWEYWIAPNGDHAYVSPSCFRVTGYSADKFMADKSLLVEIVHPRDRARFEEHLKTQLRGHSEPDYTEFRIITRDGRERWISHWCQAVFGQDDRFRGIRAANRDITKAKQAEDQLRTSRESLARAQEIANVGNWDWEIGTGRLTWSDQIYRIFGLDPKRFGATYQDFFRTIHPEDRELVTEAVAEALEGDKPYSIKHRIVRPVGDLRFVQEEAVVYRAEDGTPLRMVGTVQDVTSQTELQEQLNLAQKMEAIGTLAGGIAHDFNNLLTVIIGFTEVAQRRLSESYLPVEELDEIRRASYRAKDLVKQILTYSRQTETEKSRIDIRPIVKEAIKFTRSTLPASISFKEMIQPDVEPINGHAAQIHQVVLNLITNAAQAMSSTGGRLNVELVGLDLNNDAPDPGSGLEPGRYIRLVVADTGPGIDRSIRDRIFDPFFTTKEQGEGTGLGLSVVKGIVDDHGGSIRVVSDPSLGTRFEVYFPAAPGEADPVAEPRPISRTGRGRILLIDDQPKVLKIGRVLLEELGYETLTETSARGAVELVSGRADRIDLVITDFDMPELNGLELAQEVARIAPSVPILIASGLLHEEVLRATENPSIKGLLKKPFTEAELSAAIAGALEPAVRE